jgi:hypothetical protein
LFSVNLGKEEVELFDIPSLEIERAITNKIKREEFKIDSLLNKKEKEESWDFQNSNVISYRKKMIPWYLLDKECNDYPLYLDRSSIELPKDKSNYKLDDIIIKYTPKGKNIEF